MDKKQRVSTMAEEVLARQARARAERRVGDPLAWLWPFRPRDLVSPSSDLVYAF